MAVIDEFGITVTINTKDGPLPEFDDPQVAPEASVGRISTKFCHKYVESIDDAEFSLNLEIRKGPRTRYLWRKRATHPILICSPSIDGSELSDHSVSKSDMIQGLISLNINSHMENTSMGLRVSKFAFTQINTVDTADKKQIQKDTEISKNLGTIRLEFWRGECIRFNKENTSKLDLPVSHTISEKALKGKELSHGTSFSTTIEGPKEDFWTGANLDRSPAAVFVFKYRSKQALQHESIIPRSPSPVSDRHAVEDMPIEELRRLARERLDQIEDRKIKVEDQKPVPKRRAKRQLAEAFDLTGDTMTEMPVPKETRRDEGPVIQLDDDE